jgi:hypothetical protein
MSSSASNFWPTLSLMDSTHVGIWALGFGAWDLPLC